MKLHALSVAAMHNGEPPSAIGVQTVIVVITRLSGREHTQKITNSLSKNDPFLNRRYHWEVMTCPTCACTRHTLPLQPPLLSEALGLTQRRPWLITKGAATTRFEVPAMLVFYRLIVLKRM